jgi:hypothetical protein
MNHHILTTTRWTINKPSSSFTPSFIVLEFDYNDGRLRLRSAGVTVCGCRFSKEAVSGLLFQQNPPESPECKSEHERPTQGHEDQ